MCALRKEDVSKLRRQWKVGKMREGNGSPHVVAKVTGERDTRDHDHREGDVAACGQSRAMRVSVLVRLSVGN